MTAVVAAVVVAAVTVVGTLLTWRTTFSRERGPQDHPAWTSGPWPAVGATFAVVGVVVLVVATSAARTRATVEGLALVLVGAVTLLVERFRPTGLSGVTAVTVAVGRFDVGRASFVEDLPDASAWIVAGGLGALVVAAVALPVRPQRHTTPTAAVLAVVGAAAVALGATAFPWTFGGSGSATVPLWGAGRDAVLGVVLLALGAVLLGATARRPVRAVAVTAALLAAGGLGVLLPQRLPNPWGARVTGWYAYQPLQTLEIPPVWRFQAATTLVLLGAVLVLVAAVLVARRAVTPGPETA